MNYLHWDEKTIRDFSEKSVAAMYDKGYLFTRLGKGVMHQTRSLRLDVRRFSPTSENRRIARKTKEISVTSKKLPLADYSFTLAKLAKDFYQVKFGPGIMSAVKVKALLTDPASSNFNILLTYDKDSTTLGYAICYANSRLLHYAYPFYDLALSPKDMGLGMMLRAVEHAMNAGLKYIYLGSLQRPEDRYKLQFEGLEWFDGKSWQNDLEAVKKIISSGTMSR